MPRLEQAGLRRPLRQYAALARRGWEQHGRIGVKETGAGQPVRRKEDLRLLTGTGSFADDVDLPGQAYAAMVRSPHAHARIVAGRARRGARRAGRARGADGRRRSGGRARIEEPCAGRCSGRPMSCSPIATDRSPTSRRAFPLPADKARFAGEAWRWWWPRRRPPRRTAQSGSSSRYDAAAARAFGRNAPARAGAPRVWEEHRSNVCVDAEIGDKAASTPPSRAPRTSCGSKTKINRITGVPMEPRSVVAAYDCASAALHHPRQRLGRRCGTSRIVATVLNVPYDSIRVVYRDVGGSFGTRGMLYPETPLVAWAARRLGRPVKWRSHARGMFLDRFPRPRPRGRGRAGARQRRHFPGRARQSTRTISARSQHRGFRCKKAWG